MEIIFPCDVDFAFFLHLECAIRWLFYHFGTREVFSGHWVITKYYAESLRHIASKRSLRCTCGNCQRKKRNECISQVMINCLCGTHSYKQSSKSAKSPSSAISSSGSGTYKESSASISSSESDGSSSLAQGVDVRKISFRRVHCVP